MDNNITVVVENYSDIGPLTGCIQADVPCQLSLDLQGFPEQFTRVSGNVQKMKPANERT